MSEACCGGGACETAARPAHVHQSSPRRHETALVVAGSLIAIGSLAAWSGQTTGAVAAFAVAILVAVPRPAQGAWRSLRRGSLDINVLMVIAVVGAALLGDWLEAALVVWLFGVAHWLEAQSLARARRAIRALMSLAPDRAIVRRGADDVEVAVDAICVGDVVILRPGERLPVDGVVARGSSSLDQSPVTGESWPVETRPGLDVFAGSINGAGVLEIEATRAASDSTLARIIHLVEHAESERAPVQRWVDRFARRYTPAVVVLAVVVAAVPPLAGGLGSDVATWFYRALALLVVACPCALVISTPVSIVSALTAAARAGVLIKGGSHLERLGSIRCVAFDKTGTLTSGQIQVTDVRALAGATREGVLAIAASLEARSEHPIGRAIVDRARRDRIDIRAGGEMRALPGLGAEGAVDDTPAVVGSHRLFEERHLCTPDLHAAAEAVEGAGRTPVLVGHGGEALGVLALSDELRGNGRRAVADLRREGVRRIVLLTGDQRATAEAISAGAGLDEVHAGLMPADKVGHVARLRGHYGPVAMVGDGINDAPALAAADIGIAMGAAGTDVAIETADVALLTDDLDKLPFAVRLGRATLGNIRTNVGLALGFKVVFVVAAVSGFGTLWLAVLADTGASLLVTANSLRLLRMR